MAKRRDGKETRQRLLDIACEVFAEKGFRDAKITDICRLAGANVASVNYYFGDKESLYVAAWRQAMERFVASDMDPPADLSPEEQVAFIIQQIIRKIVAADHQGGHFRRIELMELAHPTGLLDESWDAMIAERRQRFNRLIRQIMGAEATQEAVNLCEMSIVNQCRGYLLLHKNRLASFDMDELTPARVERIAEHIARFSIAGIKASRPPA